MGKPVILSACRTVGGKQLGLASACIGGGQGVALIVKML